MELSASDSFSLYLMYKAPVPPANWVAISEMDWQWSETALSTNGVWSAMSSPQPNPVGPTTPSGAPAFPTWVNLGSQFDSLTF